VGEQLRAPDLICEQQAEILGIVKVVSQNFYYIAVFRHTRRGHQVSLRCI